MKKISFSKCTNLVYLGSACAAFAPFDTGPAFATGKAKDYRYTPYEKPDPFEPSLLNKSTVDSLLLHPLHAVPIQSMTLVGTIIGRKPAAMILAPGEKGEKRTYIVRLGERLGSNSGTAIAILSDRLIVREPIESGGNTGLAKFQDTALVLRSRDDQEPTTQSLHPYQANQNQGKSLIHALTEDLVPNQSNQGRSYTSKPKKQLESFNTSGAQSTQPNSNGALTAPADPQAPIFPSQERLPTFQQPMTTAPSSQSPQTFPQNAVPTFQQPASSPNGLNTSTRSIYTEVRSLTSPPIGANGGGTNESQR